MCICRSFFAKEPLIIGLFCGKWPIQIICEKWFADVHLIYAIRHPMGLRHPVATFYWQSSKKLPFEKFLRDILKVVRSMGDTGHVLQNLQKLRHISQIETHFSDTFLLRHMSQTHFSEKCVSIFEDSERHISQTHFSERHISQTHFSHFSLCVAESSKIETHFSDLC